MRACWAALLLLPVACAPVPPPEMAAAAQLYGSAPPAPLNAAIFAKRPPLPGQPDYLQTIKYIDDGIKYIDPMAGFFIAPTGEMCFRGLTNYRLNGYANYYSDWCAYPQAIESIETMSNDTTNVDEVRLWCRHGYPQCARRIAYVNPLDDNNWVADSIRAPTVADRQERRALQNLIYLMGGTLRAPAPVRLSTEEQ